MKTKTSKTVKFMSITVLLAASAFTHRASAIDVVLAPFQMIIDSSYVGSATQFQVRLVENGNPIQSLIALAMLPFAICSSQGDLVADTQGLIAQGYSIDEANLYAKEITENTKQLNKIFAGQTITLDQYKSEFTKLPFSATSKQILGLQ